MANWFPSNRFKYNNTTLEWFPRKRTDSAMMYWFPSGSDTYDLQLVTNSTSDNIFVLVITGDAGQKVSINYGDGNIRDVIFTGAQQTISYTYTLFSTFNVIFTGATEAISYFSISNTSTIGNIGTIKRNRISQQFIYKIPNVTYFNCAGRGFSGTLPNVSTLQYIQTFTCRGNQFSGSIPSFSMCQNITIIDLSNNNFSGIVPSFSSNINLSSIALDGTKISSFESGCFDGCINLTTASLNGNTYTSPLPSFNNLNRLTTLSIQSCAHPFPLPSDFVNNCTSLTTFNCSQSTYNGTLPSFNTCTSLTTFDCNNCSFSGTLPSFNTCTSLTSFIAQSNQFSGQLPSFSNCTLLSVFSIAINQFSGTLPSFNTCTSLTNFTAYSNQFNNSLPSFSACILLQRLLIYKNYFTGTLLSFVTNSSLTLLMIDDASGNYNKFSGDIPTLPNSITVAQLSCQSLSGDIPSFTSLTNLVDLRLTNTTTTYENSAYNSTTISDKIYSRNFGYLYITNQPITGNAPSISIPTQITYPGIGTAYYGNIYLNGCQFSSFLDMITYMYNNRTTNTVTCTVNLTGGTNVRPGGTYQAPTGYIQATTGVNGNDGTPASEMEMIYVLTNQRVDQSTTLKYRFSFTYNL